MQFPEMLNILYKYNIEKLLVLHAALMYQLTISIGTFEGRY